MRPVDDLCNIRAESTLLIFGDGDTVAPPGSQATMFAAAKSCPDLIETWSFVGADHDDYADIVPEDYPARVVDFFVAALGD